MKLLIEAQTILEKNDYVVRQFDPADKALVFEDDSIVGMVLFYESNVQFLEDWERMQDSFLQEYQDLMQKEPDKAWNSYLVILSTEVADAGVTDKIAAIEEDLRGARKIVATGMASRVDVEQALLPILPFQRKVNLSKEDHIDRLRRRIEIEELFSVSKAEDIFKAIENKK